MKRVVYLEGSNALGIFFSLRELAGSDFGLLGDINLRYLYPYVSLCRKSDKIDLTWRWLLLTPFLSP